MWDCHQHLKQRKQKDYSPPTPILIMSPTHIGSSWFHAVAKRSLATCWFKPIEINPCINRCLESYLPEDRVTECVLIWGTNSKMPETNLWLTSITREEQTYPSPTHPFRRRTVARLKWQCAEEKLGWEPIMPLMFMLLENEEVKTPCTVLPKGNWKQIPNLFFIETFSPETEWEKSKELSPGKPTLEGAFGIVMSTTVGVEQISSVVTN